MKKHFTKCLISVILMLFSLSLRAVNPTYLCRIENTAQVSCNVYEFDVVLQRTGGNALYLAMIQAGININPAIIPAGATINVSLVPGSSALTSGMQPTPDRFSFDASKNCIILQPVSPSISNKTTITNNPAGTRVCRFRVACSQPFVPGVTNNSWSFSQSTGYVTKVFAYVVTTNTDISVQASHTVNATTGNSTLTNNGFGDPVPQTLTANTTQYCVNSGIYPVISMANSQAGYTYYLYKNDTLVTGANGVCFGTGSAASFSNNATAGVYTAKSISCNGIVDMSGQVTITNATPQVPSVYLDVIPSGTYEGWGSRLCAIEWEPVTFKAHLVNAGINPIITWYFNGHEVGHDSIYILDTNQSGPVYCEIYPTEGCVTSTSVVTTQVVMITFNAPPPQVFNVSQAGTICEDGAAHVTLSGSEPGVTYWLSKNPSNNIISYGYGCVDCIPKQGTGMPLVWDVTDAGRYWVLIEGYVFCEGVPHMDEMNGSAIVVSTPYDFTEDRALCTGETYHWQGNDYSVTGTYYANYQSLTGCDSNYTLHLNVADPSDKKLIIHLFLEGLSLNNGSMRQAQNLSGNAFETGIADKVRIELHNATAPYDMDYVFDNIDLKTDGNITIDSFPCDIHGKYYLVIKHRNSLETWSSTALGFGELAEVNYNFCPGASYAYGNNVNSNGGIIRIWSGDVTQDGMVDGSDMALIDNASKPPPLMGYYPEDLNGDGIVDGSDMALADNNSSSVVHVIRP